MLDESAGVELQRLSVDLRGIGDAGEAPAAGIDFVDRMDNAGLVVLNGLSDVGDGARAEATHGDTSVIDFILVDAEHWKQMGSVCVRQGAVAAVQSDHHLIVSSLQYIAVDASSRIAADGHAPLDNASLLIRTERYSVDTRGDKSFFLPFKQKVAESCGPLVERWQSENEGGVEVSVEERWHEMACAITSAAAQTLP